MIIDATFAVCALISLALVGAIMDVLGWDKWR
jgi:hypothetical protein